MSDSQVILEVKALREWAFKMARFIDNNTPLTMVVSPELKQLLKMSKYAHPELQSMLIDLNSYHPKYLCEAKSEAPKELKFREDIPDWELHGEKLMNELYELK